MTSNLKIAFYIASNGNWQDYTIAATTSSKYSHCEIVFPDGWCASSSPRDGGVRFKQINLAEHWDVYPLKMSLNELQVNYWFNLHVGQRYDWIGAIGSAAGLDLSRDNKKYCSQACALVLNLDNSTITPGKLCKLLKQNGYINV